MEWWGWLLIGIGALIVLLAPYFIVMTYQFKNTFTIKKQMDDNTLPSEHNPYREKIIETRKYFDSLNKEAVYITSFDNLKLKADYVKGENTKKIVIFFHGYKSSCKNDFKSVKYFIEKGYSLLMVNQRAHGMSEGKYVTFGKNERIDCKNWVDYAIERFGSDVEILLMGVSMGSTTVMSSANLGLPKNVLGMVCDCGFTSGKEEISHCIKTYTHTPPFLIVPVLNLYCILFAKFSLNNVSCVTSLSESDIPILMIHGEQDDFVPYFFSVKNFAACNMENKEFVTFDCIKHAACYYADKELYDSKLDKFIKSINF